MNEITDEFQAESQTETNQPQARSGANVTSLLEGRQDMYVKAIAAAKTSGDASKSRRLERQLKVMHGSIDWIRFILHLIDDSRIAPISA